MAWSYEASHRGASAGYTHPAFHPQLTGAIHATAGEIDGVRRNAYSLAPGAGQAASVRPVIQGVQTSDAKHNDLLDGHRDSAVASHPDGQFAQNTAATSSHSNSANSKHFYPQRPVMATYDQRSGEYLDPGWRDQWVEPRVYGDRANEAEILVKTAQTARHRRMDFLTNQLPWGYQQWALGAFAVYAIYSAIGK